MNNTNHIKLKDFTLKNEAQSQYNLFIYFYCKMVFTNLELWSRDQSNSILNKSKISLQIISKITLMN